MEQEVPTGFFTLKERFLFAILRTISKWLATGLIKRNIHIGFIVYKDSRTASDETPPMNPFSLVDDE